MLSGMCYHTQNCDKIGRLTWLHSEKVISIQQNNTVMTRWQEDNYMLAWPWHTVSLQDYWMLTMSCLRRNKACHQVVINSLQMFECALDQNLQTYKMACWRKGRMFDNWCGGWRHISLWDARFFFLPSMTWQKVRSQPDLIKAFHLLFSFPSARPLSWSPSQKFTITMEGRRTCTMSMAWKTRCMLWTTQRGTAVAAPSYDGRGLQCDKEYYNSNIKTCNFQ